jgi:hypothetical protein
MMLIEGEAGSSPMLHFPCCTEDPVKVWRIQGIYAVSSKFRKFPVNIRMMSLEKPIRRPGYRARAP